MICECLLSGYITHMVFITKFKIALKVLIYLIACYGIAPFFWRITFGIYEAFFTSSISFNLDTLYLNWNTSFPAVTVCEIYNGEKMWDLSEKYYGAQHDLRIDDFVGEIVYFRGTCSTCDKCNNMNCPNNFTQLMDMFRTKCIKLLTNCGYINSYFNCCEEFYPIITEYGVCFAFNSNQARRQPEVQFANNRETGPGSLQFSATADIQVHIHPPIEIPYIQSEGLIRETLLVGTTKEIILDVNEVYNHPSVEILTAEQRHCRFAHEVTARGAQLGIYEFYSFSTCVAECMLDIQLAYCNCSSLMLSYEGKSDSLPAPMCDYRGLSCLTKHFYSTLEQRNYCNCTSSCDEPEYNIVYNSADDENMDESDITLVKISLIELPSQRYVRRVTKTSLDFIISVGGIAGLFFNASLLRLVEIIFLIFMLRHRVLMEFCKLRG